MMTSGPFYMAPGRHADRGRGARHRAAATTGCRRSRRCKFYDTDAQDAFDANFDLPNPPPQPQVTCAADHGQVTLCWDAASRLNYSEPGYAFEGYNVYQGASIAGPWTRLATFDEINGDPHVRDTVFDINTGRTITDYPVAFGTDTASSSATRRPRTRSAAARSRTAPSTTSR